MSERRDDAATVQRSKVEAPDTVVGFALDVIEGPNVGQRIVIKESDPLPALVGSGQVCSVRLDDVEVSRRHATLDIDGRSLRLKDLGSTNGTTVDGVAVIEALLRPGQTIRLGSTALKVSRENAPSIAGVARTSFGRVLGESAEMRRLYPVFTRLAASTLSVLIEGETGTGKELLAEAIHEQGPRANAPFVVFDCVSVAASDFDDEVFGRVGDSLRQGVFERANGGTLFIDQLDQLDPSVQPKLLRILERAEVTPIGGELIKLDVRVISATVRDIDHEIQAGRFREDLYHRLAGARVELPPLRRRRGDIPLLAEHYHRELGGEGPIDPRVLSAWSDDAWPGNIRELKNAVARQLAIGDELAFAEDSKKNDSRIRLEEELARVVKEAVTGGVPLARSRQGVVELYDRAYVQALLAHHEGSIAKAAAAAGIGRRYLEILRARQRGSK